MLLSDTDTFASGLWLAGLAILTGLSGTILYRWLLHPLARYPGPWLAKVTDLYGLYYLYKGRPHLQERWLHGQYGPIVRVGPNRLSFCSETAMNEIYTTNEVQKAAGYKKAQMVPGVYNTFTSIDKAMHRRKRKAANPAFSEQSIKSFEPLIIRNVDVFIQQLLAGNNGEGKQTEGDWSAPTDINLPLKCFTLDIIGDFGFGRSFETQTDRSRRGFVLALQPGVIVSAFHLHFPWLTWFNLEKFVHVKGAWSVEQIGRFTKELVEERIKAPTNSSPDIFSFVLGAKGHNDSEDGFSMDELWAESRLLLVAGSDTTSTALAGIFFYLSHYPACLEKLVREIRTTFDSYDKISLGPALSSCRYLRAVIDETLRMSPPVGNALWREVGSNGVVVDGSYVPPGTEVAAPLYTLFHTEDIFPEADTFVPERWLEHKGECDYDGKFASHLARSKAVFRPFSLGTRNCMGMNLAYAEISLLLARTLWKTDLRRAPPTPGRENVGGGSPGGPRGRRNPDEFQLRTYVTSFFEGPVLQFKLRETGA